MTPAAIPEIASVSQRQGQIARAHQGQDFTFMSGCVLLGIRFRMGFAQMFL